VTEKKKSIWTRTGLNRKFERKKIGKYLIDIPAAILFGIKRK